MIIIWDESSYINSNDTINSNDSEGGLKSPILLFQQEILGDDIG
jgi:hypothetical protein